MKRRRLDSRTASSLFAFAALVLASTIAVERAGAQAPAWKLDTAKADAAYNEAMEKLGERRSAALHKAGEAWIKAIEAEVADATRGGDTTVARGLQSKISAAREAGRVPLARPPGVVTFGRHEYALINVPKTWMEAKKHCEQLGGHLLILNSEAEEAFVLSNLGKVEFFIGATDLYTPGRYLNIDGTLFRGFAAPFKPDNFKERQNAVGWYVFDKNWNDFDDGRRMPFVCEWE